MSLKYFTSKAFFRLSFMICLGAWLICSGFKQHYENEWEDKVKEVMHYNNTAPHEFSTGSDMQQSEIDSVNREIEKHSKISVALVEFTNKLSDSIAAWKLGQKVSLNLAALALILWVLSIYIDIRIQDKNGGSAS